MGCLKLPYYEKGERLNFLGLWKKSVRSKSGEDYYPFGLTFNSFSRENSVPQNYLYNGKEMQTDLGLNIEDYGVRMYDPALARWMALDPLSHVYFAISPYVYVADNPIKYIDPDGRKIINPNNYVLSNKGFIQKLKAFDAAIARISGLNRNAYSFEITGGDRYKKDGKIYSSTNDTEVKKSSKTTMHLQENGAAGIDLANLNKSGVSYEMLQQAAEETGFRFDPEGKYDDGHFHLDLSSDTKEVKDYKDDDNVDKKFKPTEADLNPQEKKEDKKEENSSVGITLNDGKKSTTLKVDPNQIRSMGDLMREINRWLNW